MTTPGPSAERPWHKTDAEHRVCAEIHDDKCPHEPADNVHHIERPEDYLSPGEMALLAEEAEPHCATCTCGEGL